MQTYYDILGITSNASNDQIKSAFRRLAKLYHPDKNPQGKDEFGKVLLAYEILIDTSRRRQYDSKLKYGTAENFIPKKNSSSKQKEWGFSDEELKRRQYYKEHYKKEYERSVNQTTSTTKKNYNEYKYILFAAPLAVGLLMFILNTYEQSTAEETKSSSVVVKEKADELKMTDDPFTSYFKNPVFDTIAKRILVIKNFSTKDVVVAIFDAKNRFLRSGVIKSDYYIEVAQLPNSQMNLKFAIGKNWNKEKMHKNLNITGGFSDNESYAILNTEKTNGYTVTLDDNTLSNLDKISEKDFFKRD